MKARYLVHVAYYQWLMDRNEFETNQERMRSSSRETYVRLKFMRVFPDERQLGADAVGLFMQDCDPPIEPALQRKMEKAARAYAASYCSAPTGPSVQSCREAVEKVTIAGALLTRMKEDPRMTVRDAYAAELAYRDSDDYQGPWMPGEVSTTPFNKAVATKRECRFTLFFFLGGRFIILPASCFFFFYGLVFVIDNNFFFFILFYIFSFVVVR